MKSRLLVVLLLAGCSDANYEYSSNASYRKSPTVDYVNLKLHIDPIHKLNANEIKRCALEQYQMSENRDE